MPIYDSEAHTRSTDLKCCRDSVQIGFTGPGRELERCAQLHIAIEPVDQLSTGAVPILVSVHTGKHSGCGGHDEARIILPAHGQSAFGAVTYLLARVLLESLMRYRRRHYRCRRRRIQAGWFEF